MKRTSILQINLDSDVCFTCRRLDGKPQLHRGQESSLDTEFQFHNLELDSRNTSPSLKTGCFQKSSWSSISLLTKFAPRRVIALISDLHSATQMLSTVRSTLLHRRFRSIDLDTRNTYQQACQRTYRKQFRRFTDDQLRSNAGILESGVIRVVRQRTTRISHQELRSRPASAATAATARRLLALQLLLTDLIALHLLLRIEHNVIDMRTRNESGSSHSRVDCNHF